MFYLKTYFGFAMFVAYLLNLSADTWTSVCALQWLFFKSTLFQIGM